MRRFNGVAVSLAPHGVDPPAADQIKNDINLHGIGMTKKTKQVFNADANGTTITRSKDKAVTKAKEKICVFVQRNAFSQDDWERFATCKYIKQDLRFGVQSILT